MYVNPRFFSKLRSFIYFQDLPLPPMNGGCPTSMGGHCPPMNGMGGPGGPMGPHHQMNGGHHPMHLNGGGPPPPGMMSHGMGGHLPMGPPDGMMGRGGMPPHSLAPCTSSGSGGNCSMGPSSMTSYTMSGSHGTSTSVSSVPSPSVAPLPPDVSTPGSVAFDGFVNVKQTNKQHSSNV